MSYSEQITQEIVDEYKANPCRETVDAIALRIGKSARSVIAKLAAEGCYYTPERTTKTGEIIVKKDELVADINEWLAIDTPTLAKTSKLELKALHLKIKELIDARTIS
jgi:hypothetical protein